MKGRKDQGRGRVVSAPDTEMGLREHSQCAGRWQKGSCPVSSAEQIFPSSLARLPVLVSQPLPALSGHRAMFALALQPEIW